jgi:hypothetical protein
MVSAFGAGDGRPLRLDGGTGARDTGVMISCVYCAGGGRAPAAAAGGDAGAGGGGAPCMALTRTDAGAAPVEVELRADRLIAFRSRTVANGLRPIPPSGAAPLLLVTVFVHGMPDAF